MLSRLWPSLAVIAPRGSFFVAPIVLIASGRPIDVELPKPLMGVMTAQKKNPPSGTQLHRTSQERFPLVLPSYCVNSRSVGPSAGDRGVLVRICLYLQLFVRFRGNR